MNIHNPIGSRLPARSSAWKLLPLIVLAAATGSRGAEPAPAAAEPRTHTLFMGADILVQQDTQAYRVENVVGEAFVIKVDGREVKVPANGTKVKMKVDRSLKLTASSVDLAHLKAERAYTSATDPVKKFMAQQGEVAAAEDALTGRASFYGTAQSIGNAEAHASKGGEAGMTSLYGDPALAERQMNRAAAAGQSALGRDASLLGQMQDVLAKELFDAIYVEFDVSSAQLVAKPYVVMMAEFHAPDSKAGESQNWLYAAALAPLDSKLQKVRVRAGGFPPGYSLDKFQVHVYDGGQEVATSVSEKQVPLTRTEAFTYLVINYVGSHKGATVRAAPAMGSPSPGAKARLSNDQLQRTYFVKVSKDGLPVAAFVDAGCRQPVDDTVAALITEVRFYPALDQGRTVEGVAELRLNRLAL